jgi:aldehyde:ferredoxin oxidoreductase
MKSITATLPRFKPMFGWTNRILRVDLTEGRIWAQETAPYAPDYIGARGIAARILWDEYPEPVDPLDPRNPFMVMPGALTGTIAPYSGRTNICAFSPQCSPYPWFSRSSIGADWGARLKRAGYDGLVVTGASETPVHVLIRDDEVSILPADGPSTSSGRSSRSLTARRRERWPSARPGSGCRASPPCRRTPRRPPGRAALAR